MKSDSNVFQANASSHLPVTYQNTTSSNKVYTMSTFSHYVRFSRTIDTILVARLSVRLSVCYAAHCTHTVFLQENLHLNSATLHVHPFFLPLILHFNSIFFVSRRLLYLIFTRRLVFLHVIWDVKASSGDLTNSC